MKKELLKSSRWKRGVGMLLLIFFSVTAAFAQNLVRGVVIDKAGEGIPGASIQVKGTAIGTISDVDGRFSIGIQNKNAKLVVSFIGYVTAEVEAVLSKPMSIVLNEDTKLLDEVVVVGYQEVKKKDLTGSVAKVNMDDLLSAPVSSFDQTLGGRLAGVNVTSNEGMPGGTMNIVIRGNNSLTQSNSPLYVIDGFPVEDAEMAGSINPADIESLDVLKDASATAIYGARGANGVVIITTKKGKIGKAQIAYDGSVTMHHVKNLIPMMDAYEFVKLQNEIAPQLIHSGTGGYFMEWEGKQWAQEDYVNIPQYDWQDEIFQTAWQQSHNIRLTGGTEGVRYNGSVSYYNQDGVVLRSNYERFQARMNVAVRRDKLNVNFTADYSRAIQTGASPSQSNYTGQNNLFYNVWGYRPVNFPNKPLEALMNNSIDTDVVNPSNDYRFQPVVSLKNEYNKSYQNSLRLNGFAEYEFIKGLKLKVSGGYNYYAPTSDNFNNSKTRYGSSTDKVNARVTRAQSINWLNENTLSYQTYFKKKHSFNALVGMTLQGNDSETYSFYTHHIPNESLGMAGMYEGTSGATNSGQASWALLSYLARVNYNFNSKYYATASFRADGSSKFNKKNRYGYFPSASLAWNFSEEKRIKSLQFISNGKLRLSWGLTGNNRVGEYDMYSLLAVRKAAATNLTSGVYPFDNDFSTAGMVPVTVGNWDLKWETTEQWNLGLDLGAFGNRINLTTDIYRKTTRDLLLDATLPYSSGFANARKNIGKVRNEGIELTLNTVNIKTRKFTWSTDFNIAFNRNEVLELAENQESLMSIAQFDGTYNNNPNYIARVGYPMGLMYGYIFDGTYKYEDFNRSGSAYTLKANVPHFSTENATQPGMPKYRDLDGNGVIDSADRTVIGRGAPIHTGGFTNNFSYKGFDLNIFFQWSYGNDILNANRLFFESGNGKARDLNQFASYANRWTPENPDSDIPAATASISNKVISSRIVEDGSFLRLKSVTLGYSLPKKAIAKVHLSNVRVYLAAQNLWTWTSYSGFDPEVSVRNSALTPGLDFSAYPRTVSCSFGVSLGL
jgi:TonB-linked SusC/RagA family outer membrane protein